MGGEKMADQKDGATAKQGIKYEPGMTMGYDARFPNISQGRACWQYYCDFHRCQRKMGEDYKPCLFFKNSYEAACPSFWVDMWDEQRESGTFPARYVNS